MMKLTLGLKVVDWPSTFWYWGNALLFIFIFKDWKQKKQHKKWILKNLISFRQCLKKDVSSVDADDFRIGPNMGTNLKQSGPGIKHVELSQFKSDKYERFQTFKMWK
jgi:hypothetical protein